MLVVAETVPGGPAEGVLQPGDVLISVEDRLLTRFAPLEAEVGGTTGARMHPATAGARAATERIETSVCRVFIPGR